MRKILFSIVGSLSAVGLTSFKIHNQAVDHYYFAVNPLSQITAGIGAIMLDEDVTYIGKINPGHCYTTGGYDYIVSFAAIELTVNHRHLVSPCPAFTTICTYAQ